jgi:hypothetical protein
MTTPQPAAPQPDHDLTLPYQKETLPGSAIDLDRWQCWSHTDAQIVHYYAKGPCPACRADTQNHLADVPHPIEEQGRSRDRDTPPAVTPTVEIPVQCCCGSNHGQPGASGCGRGWTLIVPRVSAG